MSEDVAARLALVEKLRPLERAVARDAFTRKAAELLRSRTHELGNQLQIVRLASLELENRGAGPDAAELVTDLRAAAEQATTILMELLAAARPEERNSWGPPVAPLVREAVELARPAVPAGIDLVCELPDDVRSLCSAEELEGLVVAALLDTPRTRVVLRARTIAGKPWLQLLFIGARHDRVLYDELVEALATRAGGEVSVSPGREGTELAIELPAARS